jgi:elongation factor Ts
MVKKLREETGAGVLDCKKALEQTDGDFEQAAEILRQKGLAAAAKKSTREAHEGIVGSYIHMGAKVAALVELNCETDFVARTDEFQTLARDLAMQVVASRPRYVHRQDIPADVLEQERASITAQGEVSNKPTDVVDKMIDGKMEKFYQETVLLEQPYIKDPGKSVGDLITASVAKLGENIVVRRFARFEIGEEL